MLAALGNAASTFSRLFESNEFRQVGGSKASIRCCGRTPAGSAETLVCFPDTTANNSLLRLLHPIWILMINLPAVPVYEVLRLSSQFQIYRQFSIFTDQDADFPQSFFIDRISQMSLELYYVMILENSPV